MKRTQAEARSIRNAQKVIKGTDKLKSWGKTGFVFLPRLKRKFHYRSLLERDILLEIDKYDGIIDIDSEPFMIPYFFQGMTHQYVPDIIVKLVDNSVWIFEVKPRSQICEAKNQAKFYAASRYCSSFGSHLHFNVVSKAGELTVILENYFRVKEKS